jgi:alpha-tubulin suppressor-like RCC1 family protein
MWGRGEVHQLGINNRQLCKDEMGYVALKPVQLTYFSTRNIHIKAGTCGDSHTLLLDSLGKVFAFGWGELGQLGLERKFLNHQMRTNEITCVSLINEKVKKVAAGLAFSAALCENGDVVVWGLGTLGQLGMGPGVKKLEHPTKVNLDGEVVVDLACGENCVIALTANGNCFAWGLGKTGVFSYMEAPAPVGTDMVCPFPRVLGETDIVHHFVVGFDRAKVLGSLNVGRFWMDHGNAG